MANQPISSSGTQLWVSATLPTPATEGNPLAATDFAALEAMSAAPFKRAIFLADLPTPDPTRAPSRLQVLDEVGEVVGFGATTNATQDFVIYGIEGRDAGYNVLRKGFLDKQTVACKVVYPDGYVKWYLALAMGGQESAPINGNFQMAVSLVVQGEVINVDPS